MDTKTINQRPVAPDVLIVQVEPVTVNLEQAAQMMGGADPATLRKWIRKAGFPFLKVGGRVLIPVDRMRQWVDDNVGKTLVV